MPDLLDMLLLPFRVWYWMLCGLRMLLVTKRKALTVGQARPGTTTTPITSYTWDFAAGTVARAARNGNILTWINPVEFGVIAEQLGWRLYNEEVYRFLVSPDGAYYEFPSGWARAAIGQWDFIMNHSQLFVWPENTFAAFAQGSARLIEEVCETIRSA